MSTMKSARQRAAEAGARGKSAKPLGYMTREANYLHQNELTGRGMTARQVRQLNRMRDRMLARVGAA
jgi:hypothetical protein